MVGVDESCLKTFQELKREGVNYVVAPYEADAQLAYMEKEGIIDGIITEDSDLLVFGCKQVKIRTIFPLSLISLIS